MEFAPWIHDATDQNLAWLYEKAPDILAPNSWRWYTGESLASWFPDDVTFDFSKNHGIQLADSIPNTQSCLVVSEKLKALLAVSGASFEFFPVKIRDRKKKVVPESYYLANLVGVLSCMDKGKSDFSLSNIDGQVRRFRHLVLDNSKIPEGTQVFRLADMSHLYLVCCDLAVKIKRQEMCTGMRFLHLEDYGKEWRTSETVKSKDK
jgi:hypothetical protein